eukprot:Selendium_serpulae@DN5197_c0_g1_i1.p1
MPNVLQAVKGSSSDQCPVKTVLVSVSDKTGLNDLASELSRHHVKFVSTGGTAKYLRDAGFEVQDVSDLTKCEEILDGRVKTLHPKVYAGILAARGNEAHDACLAAQAIPQIDLVVVNLYPFDKAIETGSWETSVENIDIGGVSLIRAAAKNCSAVAVSTNPDQYASLIEELQRLKGCFSSATRKRLAIEGFKVTASYDSAIALYYERHHEASPKEIKTTYKKQFDLKYGVNPHQPAAIYSLAPLGKLPFHVVNGNVGFINLLDALNAWQLVQDLSHATGLPAAASFKHVSPAGAAVGIPLSELEKNTFFIDHKLTISSVAAAYIRARNSDPMSSFGDFAAVSGIVDESLATILRAEVCDGIIATGFSDEAKEILRSKKNGSFVMLEGDRNFNPPEHEIREIFGVCFRQKRNTNRIDASILGDIRTQKKTLPEDAQRDLIVATVAAKYTQSNSVVYARNGMTIGIGAGQQSRIDCVRLAGRKAANWWFRFHPNVLNLKYAEGLKRHERNNARTQFIEETVGPNEIEAYNQQFASPSGFLGDKEKELFLTKLSGVSLSSDAFFPFTDCFCCKKYGVEYIAQPGGSVGDKEVLKASDINGITMVFTGLRLFHH